MKRPLLKLTTLLCSGIIAMLGLGACKSSKALEREEQKRQSNDGVRPIDKGHERIRALYGVRPTPYINKMQEETE